MNTKIVYVIVSSDNDIYTEQMYMSMWSCIKHNPDAEIVILADDLTLKRLDVYPEIRSMAEKIVVEPFPLEMSNVQKSRILKTNIPKYVTDPFLYVDVDTVFCGAIDIIDSLDTEIALVEDRHVKFYSQTGMLKKIMTRSYNIFGRMPKINAKYYNGGVIYCKNTKIGKAFFEKWYQNWTRYIDATNDYHDQTALFESTEEYHKHVKSMGNAYNVQVGAYKNPQVRTGVILHFYNTCIGIYDDLHPFFDKTYYDKIKAAKTLGDDVANDILLCKNSFNYNFYNKKYTFIPKVFLDFYRVLRWKTYYQLIRYPAYYFYKIKLRGRI
ncbi:MAG: hypothetical protein J1F05_08640 [Muribaculaceae bacterium]|nr:hypothetical protein [Muribaculaceae bacterium]